jgi:hypothetical protein
MASDVAPIKELLDRAFERTRAALNDPRAVEWLHDYYDPDSNYAGATFLTLQPNPVQSVEATDLYAVSLLEVSVEPRAGRKMLNDGPTRTELNGALAAIPAGADLLTASDEVIDAASNFYLVVKRILGGNKWLTASKLCARKRPEFFPIRDRVVTFNMLGIGRDYRTDWQVYRELIGDRQIRISLDTRIDEARAYRDGVAIPDPPLRVLDVVLWMSADRGSGSGLDVAETDDVESLNA